MNKGLVKSEILCPRLWGEDPFLLELPPMYIDDVIHMDFTIPTYGKIEGLFKVKDLLHLYNGSTGYTQRLVLEPDE